MGLVPIMIRSNRCNLEGAFPKELIKHHEESEEFGGYFLVNGIEKLIRLLIVPRRNHVIALIRSSFTNRGPTYSTFGTAIRCARPDQTSQTNTVHYLTDGGSMLRFAWRKQEYLVPTMLILKVLHGWGCEHVSILFSHTKLVYSPLSCTPFGIRL